jgi:hypothetical protein
MTRAEETLALLALLLYQQVVEFGLHRPVLLSKIRGGSVKAVKLLGAETSSPIA